MRANPILRINPFYQGLRIKYYTINTEKLLKRSVRIMLVTDLHGNIHRKNHNRLMCFMRQEAPDLIVLAGDIADASRSLAGVKQFFEGIQSIAPVYYAIGNHELKSRRMQEIKQLCVQYQIRLLSNEFELVQINGEELMIGGADDPSIAEFKEPEWDWEKRLMEVFNPLFSAPQYRILLSHRPELVKQYRQMPFDLYLSGHAHGGQVRIPFLLNGLYAPGQGLFPKYAGGLYLYQDKTHIVSRGASFHLLRPRIWNPPEIDMIEIMPFKNTSI